MTGVVLSRTKVNQRCPLPFGLILNLLAFFFLFVACASPPPPEHTPPQLHTPSDIQTQSGPLSSLPRGRQAAPVALSRHTGLSIAPLDVPRGLELDAWVDALSRAGFTMILLDVGTRAGERPADEARPIGSLGAVYFRTGLAEMARDVFGEVAPVAHRYGLSIFAAVSLRRMNWVDPTLGWMDRAYDPVQQQLRITPYLDLFHPAFQEYLTGLFLDLADAGIDGVVFRSDAPLGPMDGFSVFALRGFERDFQIKADPTILSPVPVSGTPTTEETVQPQGFQPNNAPEFWQWTGWKAREMMKVMVRLGQAMRIHVPSLLYALEIHPETVTDPLKALVQYGEDLLEAKHSGFQFFLVRSSAQPTPVSASFLDRMGQLIGGMERIWIPALLPGADIRHPQEWPPLAGMREELERDVGLIYMAN